VCDGFRIIVEMKEFVERGEECAMKIPNVNEI
jgi:hypothetical protein